MALNRLASVSRWWATESPVLFSGRSSDVRLIDTVAVAITVLSLGYDMVQPHFAGLVTSIGGRRPGQAMGLNVFMLFVGFGLGSFVFGEVVRLGFAPSLGIFAAVSQYSVNSRRTPGFRCRV